MAASAAAAGPHREVAREDSIDVALAEGEAALAAGRPLEAIDALRRAQGHLGLELLYQDDDRFYEAESAAIYRGLAEAYMAAGEPYAAAVEAARGVNLTAADGRLWTLLGLARYRLADMDGAAEALAEAEALLPVSPEIQWGLGLLAIAANRPGEARERAARAFTLQPDPRYALARAQWAVVEDDYAAAATALEDFLRLSPDDPHAPGYRHLARFYREVARAPAHRIDPGVTRLQLNFDLKPGDEIPYVPASFDGGPPAYILFDTGAERNVIDRAFVESIGVGPIFEGGRLHGAYRQSPGGYAIVDSLGLGSVVVERVPFAVGDFAALRLRGQGAYYIAAVINPALVFRDFLVVLDYHHRRIELVRYGQGGEDYAGRRTRLRKTTTPFWFDANGVWPVLAVSLDGARPLPFLVDTGASDLLIGRRTAASLLLDPQRLVASAGGHTREGLRALLLDGRPAEPWGIGVHGILGFPFVRGMRIAFDYQAMNVVLEN